MNKAGSIDVLKECLSVTLLLRTVSVTRATVAYDSWAAASDLTGANSEPGAKAKNFVASANVTKVTAS